MSSPTEIKTCGVCYGNLSGQVMFTAECSHCFHFSCISNSFANANNHLCPVCQSRWNINNLPFTMPIPIPKPHIDPINIHHPPFYPFPRIPRPVFDPEPLHFTDDDPLPNIDLMSSSDSLPVSRKIAIKASPEQPAIASSQSVSQFTVLVGIKAPSLSDGTCCSQRAPIDLVTVLDVSSSMDGSKLPLLKRAVHFVIDNLGPQDRLSIVSFATEARRILPLRGMTEKGIIEAKRAVNSLRADGLTNIVQGLKKGVRVLDERQQKNPVTSIIFLSDGNDTCNHYSSMSHTFSTSKRSPGYLHLLPDSIFGKNRGRGDAKSIQTIPVHSFGFGSDHDPVTMHAISDASGGTFSFIESYEMVQDAFASCIGGLLSVVTQEVRLTLRSASHGVEIKSISSGRYTSAISNQGSQGLINVGDLYADEEKEFLITLSVSMLPNRKDNEDSERKTSLLDIMCCHRDLVSKEVVKIEGGLVEIKRPKTLSPGDMVVNLEVDRQRNRLYAAESIEHAQQMAETGDLYGARALLADTRSTVMGSASARGGDGLCMWLQNDMKETEKRFESERMYQRAGRAYALSGMSSHAMQRATTKGNMVAGAAPPGGFGYSGFGGGAFRYATAPCGGGFATPNMVNMVNKSQQATNTGDDAPNKE